MAAGSAEGGHAPRERGTSGGAAARTPAGAHSRASGLAERLAQTAARRETPRGPLGSAASRNSSSDSTTAASERPEGGGREARGEGGGGAGQEQQEQPRVGVRAAERQGAVRPPRVFHPHPERL